MKEYKYRLRLSIYRTLTHLLGHMSEREEVGIRERDNYYRRSSLCFWVLILVLILCLRKLWGFLLYGFPEENYLCLLSLLFIVVHVILSVKDPKIMLA